MRLSAMVFVVSAAALIAACQPQGEGGDAAQAPAPPPPAGDTAEAAPFDLLRAEGAQVNWIEAQIGPARTVVAGEREYDIGDCTVRMQAEDEVVTGYAVPMSAACASLVLPVLAHYGLPETVEMTFGQFAQARTNPAFRADCLHLCGNAADPWVYLESPGPRVTPGIRASAPLVDGDIIDASFDLRDRMRAEHGDDYVIDGRFNCDEAWSAAGRETLAPFRIQEIEVGYTPIERCD
ncbi:MAG: hypothetical protein J0L52_00950 [Caulobacterales bacterium]|nr:hypothetical protein [Caulobacterales bacterium]